MENASIGIGSADAARVLGISNRQLDHWDTRGVVMPSLESASGSGSRRRYSDDDVLMLLVAKELRGLAVGLEAIGQVVAAIQHAGVAVDCAVETRLVWARGAVVAIETDPALSARAALLEPASIVIHLGRLAASARGLLAKHQPAITTTIDIEGRRYRVVVSVDQHGVTARGGGQTVTADTDASALVQLAGAIRQSKGSTTSLKSAPSDQPTPQRPSSSGAAAWGADW